MLTRYKDDYVRRKKQSLKRIRNIFVTHYAETALSFILVCLSIYEMPRVVTSSWLATSALFIMGILLSVIRLRRFSGYEPHKSLTHARRASIFARSLLPLAFCTAFAPILVAKLQDITADQARAALFARDQAKYDQSQYWNAFYIDPDAVLKAVDLVHDSFGNDSHVNCEEGVRHRREQLAADAALPDTLRRSLYRGDLECNRRAGNENAVAAEIVRIHQFPFEPLSTHTAAIADAFYELHDYKAGRLISTLADSVARTELRRLQFRARDPQMRHAIALALMQ